MLLVLRARLTHLPTIHPLYRCLDPHLVVDAWRCLLLTLGYVCLSVLAQGTDFPV